MQAKRPSRGRRAADSNSEDGKERPGSSNARLEPHTLNVENYDRDMDQERNQTLWHYRNLIQGGLGQVELLKRVRVEEVADPRVNQEDSEKREDELDDEASEPRAEVIALSRGPLVPEKSQISTNSNSARARMQAKRPSRGRRAADSNLEDEEERPGSSNAKPETHTRNVKNYDRDMDQERNQILLHYQNLIRGGQVELLKRVRVEEVADPRVNQKVSEKQGDELNDEASGPGAVQEDVPKEKNQLWSTPLFNPQEKTFTYRYGSTTVFGRIDEFFDAMAQIRQKLPTQLTFPDQREKLLEREYIFVSTWKGDFKKKLAKETEMTETQVITWYKKRALYRKAFPKIDVGKLNSEEKLAKILQFFNGKVPTELHGIVAKWTGGLETEVRACLCNSSPLFENTRH